MLREDKADFVLKLWSGVAIVSTSFRTQDLLNSPQRYMWDPRLRLKHAALCRTDLDFCRFDHY